MFELSRKKFIAVVAASALGFCATAFALLGFYRISVALLALLLSSVPVMLALIYSHLRAQDHTQLARFKHLQRATIKAVKDLDRDARSEFASNQDNQARLLLGFAEELHNLAKSQSGAGLASGIERNEFIERLNSLSTNIESNAADTRSGLDGATTQLRSYVQDEIQQVLKNQSAQNQRMAAWYETLRLKADRVEELLAHDAADSDSVEAELTERVDQADKCAEVAGHRDTEFLTVNEVGHRADSTFILSRPDGRISDGDQVTSRERGRGIIAKKKVIPGFSLMVPKTDLSSSESTSRFRSRFESCLTHMGFIALIPRLVDRVRPREHEPETFDSDVLAKLELLEERQAHAASRLQIAMYDETRQAEALMKLLPNFEPRWMMPPLGRWAVDARSMLHLQQVVRDFRPKNILELGGGTSSVWLGYLAEEVGASVTSIENDEKFKLRTDEYLRCHQLEAVVSTVLAPLTPLELGPRSFEWYDLRSFNTVKNIDILFVDGPSGLTNELARFPALSVLFECLTEDAVLILDDSERDDEQEIIARWQEEYDLERLHEGFSRLAVFRVKGKSSRFSSNGTSKNGATA